MMSSPSSLCIYNPPPSFFTQYLDEVVGLP